MYLLQKIAETLLCIYSTLNSCKLLTSNLIAEQVKIIADLILDEFFKTNKNVPV